jgi:DNA-binding MarR family transcriptional regulator
MLAWIHMMRSVLKIQRREMFALGRFNLTLPQFEVLSHLLVTEGTTQQMLADHLLVTKGNVCGLIDRLAEQGLVERQADPDDRRANRLYLTPAGRALIIEVLPTQRAVIRELLATLTHEEQRTLLALLGRLDRALGPL